MCCCNSEGGRERQASRPRTSLFATGPPYSPDRPSDRHHLPLLHFKAVAYKFCRRKVLIRLLSSALCTHSLAPPSFNLSSIFSSLISRVSPAALKAVLTRLWTDGRRFKRSRAMLSLPPSISERLNHMTILRIYEYPILH